MDKPVDSYPFLTDLYRARLVRVIDGDTLDVELDCGFRVRRTERLRLLGVNTAELHSKDLVKRQSAQSAMDFVSGCLLRKAIAANWPIKVQTSKSDAFGRYLARIWWLDEAGGEHSLNDELIAVGLAEVRP